MTTTAPRITIPLLNQIPNAPDGWEWQNTQQSTLDRVMNSTKRIIMLQAEPGTGKTLLAWSMIKLFGGRGLTLVHTRQLERQYLRDFQDMVLMEGRAHFQCALTGRAADDAPCSVGVKCHLKRFGCEYYDRKRAATYAAATVHNYAYWLSETRHATKSPFKNVKTIVCDEAHDIQSVLMDAESIDFSNAQYRDYGSPPTTGLADLREWAAGVFKKISGEHAGLVTKAIDLGIPIETDYGGELGITDLAEFAYDTYGSSPPKNHLDLIKEIGAVRRKLGDLQEFLVIGDDQFNDESERQEWIVDTSERNVVRVRPLYGKRGFDRIRQSAERVILMSAYLAPHLLIKTLGLNPDDVDVIETGKIFDREKSPVLYTPVVKMNYNTKDYEWQRVVKVIDGIIEEWAPRSGLIHVPSVALRDRILSMTKHRDLMITYEGGRPQDGALTKDEALVVFKEGEGQRVLLGQSISTGVDIPYVPEFNIIVKMSFPPTTDPALRARMRVDKDYYPFLTICELVQAVGRGKRAADHHSTTFILDAQFDWFHKANRPHFPSWFSNNLKTQGWRELPKLKQRLLRAGVIVN